MKLVTFVNTRKQIDKRNKKYIYKSMVKKKGNSKRTYSGTKKTMKARRKQEKAREHKQKRK